MNALKPKAVELYDGHPQKHIEAIGRICYKSEDRITDDSHAKFITNMYKNQHWAMLEHFRFVLVVSKEIYEGIGIIKSPFIVMTETRDLDMSFSRYVVSASARGFLDALAITDPNTNPWYDVMNRSMDLNAATVALLACIKHIVYDYGDQVAQLFPEQSPCRQKYHVQCVGNLHDLSEYEQFKHSWHSVLFTVDRGVTHEFVRHRPASFAQESTRYCNYANGKFGGEIAVIDPLFWQDNEELRGLWEKAMRYDEEMYKQMIHAGAKPQEARTVLPQSTKADIVITATNEEWKHVVDLRYTGITGKPHPQMVEAVSIMVDKYEWARKLVHLWA